MANNSININFKDLEGLNIENLFPSNDGTRTHTSGKLDINTLFDNQDNTNNFSFDSRTLLEGIKRKREKLMKCNQGFYKSCCDTIISANRLGKTDITFEIPRFVPDCQNFKSRDCLLFIKNKLNEQYVSCSILSDIVIFVTWNDIEQKLSNEHIE